MKKIFYCFLLLTFFVLSCSKEEADMDGSQNKETENKERYPPPNPPPFYVGLKGAFFLGRKKKNRQ